MNGSIIPSTTTVAALTAALMVTGCCGPKRDRTASYYNSPSASAQYSSTTTRDAETSTTTETYSAPATRTTEAERTNVRESVGGAGQNQWSLPLYSESLRVGKREVENGSVRLRKVVRTEQASQPVELRRETVVIDRQAFDEARRAADAGQANNFGMAFQEKEITIDLTREEPVVEVQQFISGRIVAEKRVTTDQQNVARQVRHEQVEIIKNGNEKDIVISENVRADAIGGPGRQNGTVTSERDDASTRREGSNGSIGQRTNSDESEPPRRQTE